MGTSELIGRVCSLRSMNNDKSKVLVGIDYGKSFPKVSPQKTVDYGNDLEFSSLSSAFKFSGTKRMMLQVPETHFNRQGIVY